MEGEGGARGDRRRDQAPRVARRGVCACSPLPGLRLTFVCVSQKHAMITAMTDSLDKTNSIAMYNAFALLFQSARSNEVRVCYAILYTACYTLYFILYAYTGTSSLCVGAFRQDQVVLLASRSAQGEQDEARHPQRDAR